MDGRQHRMNLDRPEFEKLALEQLDMLYRIARRLARDQATAEDLVQETYLRALRSYQTFDLQQYGIRPWLLRIMHNLHTTRYQREKRQPIAMEDAKLEAATPLENGDARASGMANLWDHMDEELMKAVTSLPEEYQVVMMLWAVEDLSYKEIAESLEVPIGTVMSRLHRARRRLAEQLKGFATQQGFLRSPREPEGAPDVLGR
jgi:RNA polymerase sigma-70 factor (ECF subfamily)